MACGVFCFQKGLIIWKAHTPGHSSYTSLQNVLPSEIRYHNSNQLHWVASDSCLFLATNPLMFSPLASRISHSLSSAFHPLFEHHFHSFAPSHHGILYNFCIEFIDYNLPWEFKRIFANFDSIAHTVLSALSFDSCCMAGACDSWQRKWFNFRSTTMGNHPAAFGSCKVKWRLWEDCTTCNWNYVYFCFCSHFNRQWVQAGDAHCCSCLFEVLIFQHSFKDINIWIHFKFSNK